MFLRSLIILFCIQSSCYWISYYKTSREPAPSPPPPKKPSALLNSTSNAPDNCVTVHGRRLSHYAAGENCLICSHTATASKAPVTSASCSSLWDELAVSPDTTAQPKAFTRAKLDGGGGCFGGPPTSSGNTEVSGMGGTFRRRRRTGLLCVACARTRLRACVCQFVARACMCRCVCVLC